MSDSLKKARRIATLIRQKKPIPCALGSAEEYIVALDTALRAVTRAARKRVEHQLVEEHVGLEGAISVSSWHDLMNAIGMKPACRRCGCTEARACPGGCSWAEVNLCTACDPLPDPLRRTR